ncbi:MAG: ImmA/IrrE family metallo-endopeptidase [Firmicutes bacterium]|nr:ImmA/IrrE family metallo-endopeptidase [Bacillota bacterium]
MALTPQRKKEIENKAQELLVKHGQTKLPIDPKAVVEGEGLSVFYEDIVGNCTGLLDRENKRIIVDSDLAGNLPHANCVIAHELGHYFLNLGTAKGEGAENDDEYEANYFAHTLLMPAPYVEKLVEIYNEKEETAFDSLVQYLCYMFQVTERKARHRLGELRFGF